MRRTRKTIFACGFSVAVIWAALTTAGYVMVSYHNHQLRQVLTSLDAQAVVLNEIVPFDWDAVYTFAPYLTRDEMAKIIGFKSGSLRETVNTRTVQLVFVKNATVVSSVCGYGEILGYSVGFTAWEGDYAKITVGDHAVFAVENKEGIVRLSHISSVNGADKNGEG